MAIVGGDEKSDDDLQIADCGNPLEDAPWRRDACSDALDADCKGLP